METRTSRICDTVGPCVEEEAWQPSVAELATLLERLDANGLNGTFEHPFHWLTRLTESAEGIAVTETMLGGGHEIALHHHGYDHDGWDGYSDSDAASTQHGVYKDVTAQPMSAYMNLVNAWEADHGYEIVTMEGTDLMSDGQPEWTRGAHRGLSVGCGAANSHPAAAPTPPNPSWNRFATVGPRCMTRAG